jgi:serine/threonine protein kinase
MIIAKWCVARWPTACVLLTQHPQAIKVVQRIDPNADRYRALRKTKIPQSGAHLPHTERITSTENKIRKEIAIMKKCQHAHIVRLYEVIDDRTHKKILMSAHTLSCTVPQRTDYFQLWSSWAVVR